MKNLDWLQSLEKSIESLGLSDSVNSFRANVFFPLSQGKDSQATFRGIFGDAWLAQLKNVRFQKQRFNIALRLPSDAVLIFRPKKEGLIAASLKGNFVLKIFQKEPYKTLLDEESKTLEDFSGTSFAKFAPGFISRGDGWLLTTFCSNSKSLTAKLDPEKYLFSHFKELILPGLTELYKSSPSRVIDLHDWVREASERANQHPSRDMLLSLLREIKAREAKGSLIHSRIHHDLHAGNILVNENGPVFIDWEGRVEGLVLVDFYDFIRRCDGPSKEAVKAFLRTYQAWSEAQFGASLTDAVLDLFPLIYTVERTLLLFEKRRVDRMKDLKGFEYKTWHQFCS